MKSQDVKKIHTATWLEPAIRQILDRVAKNENRSISKQVGYYILAGLRADGALQVESEVVRNG